MDIHHLLNYLGGLFPLTHGYPVALAKVTQYRLAGHKEKLLEPPSRAFFVWFLMSGIVSASIFDKEGKEVVIRIYLPPVVFTDLNSFLHNKPSALLLRVLGSAELQYISLTDFRDNLLPFSETQELREQIMLQDQLLDQQRSGLLSLTESHRFVEFAGLYPMDQIPNVTAASFLNMGTSKYCTLKADWNASSKR
ncbi:MAG: Crp/Fnr family transcriptional regulator [Pedobacter sp.]|nr:MAG: Crp/Fnr family transcriptional regulator [Pedobacter sp.]